MKTGNFVFGIQLIPFVSFLIEELYFKKIRYVLLFHFSGATHMDGFPEELREVAHDHWGTFPPQHPLIPDLFAILFFFLWIVSFLGNGCVIYIFLCTPKLRSPVSTTIIA